MATIDWHVIENPQAQRPKRRYEGANITFKYNWIDDTTKPLPDGTFEKKQVEFAEIYYPGGEKTPVPISEIDIRGEYAAEYNAWKNGISAPLSGKPLADWTVMPRSVVEELAYHGIHTIEQLEDLPDESKRKLGPLQNWCKKAKEFKKAQSATPSQLAAALEKIASLEERNKKQEEQIALMQKRIEQVGA